MTILVTQLLSHSTGIHFQAACLLILLSLLLHLLPPSASPLHSLNSVFQFILTFSIMNMYGSCVQSHTVHHFTLPASCLYSSGNLHSKMSFLLFFFKQDVLKSIPCLILSSVQSLSRIRLCDPTDCSTPGLLVHHQLLELTQTHVH